MVNPPDPMRLAAERAWLADTAERPMQQHALRLGTCLGLGAAPGVDSLLTTATVPTRLATTTPGTTCGRIPAAGPSTPWYGSSWRLAAGPVPCCDVAT